LTQINDNTAWIVDIEKSWAAIFGRFRPLRSAAYLRRF